MYVYRSRKFNHMYALLVSFIIFVTYINNHVRRALLHDRKEKGRQKEKKYN